MRNLFNREPHVGAHPQPAPPVELPPGFFGKAPTVGDFMSRHIPYAFAPQWETWLQEMLFSSRDILGSGWRDAWLSMPVWHFALGADLVAPTAAYGVLIPSVDRVGREFPMTVLAVGREQGVAVPSWALQAEQLILSSLEDDFTPDKFEAKLAALGAPRRWPASDRSPRPGTSPIVTPRDWPEEVDLAVRELARGETMWWCRGSALVPPMLVRSAGLPSSERSARFVIGFDFGRGAAAEEDILS